jgi:hypothetical protein
VTDTCEKCGAEIQVGAWPYCPHGAPRGSIIRDEIPGGLTITNMGHEPVTVYSWSERNRIMKARGLREQVRHMPLPGTDKSPHTSRWI